MNIIPVFFVICLLSACNKNIPVTDPNPCDPEPCDTSKLMGKLDTLWSCKIRIEEPVNFTDGIFFKDESIYIVGATPTRAYVISYTRESGERNWIWEEIPVSHFSTSFMFGLKLLVQNREDIASIHLTNGSSEIIYKLTDHRASNTYGQLLGSHFYFTIRTLNDSRAWIVRSHVSDLQTWETVYTLERGEATGGSRPQIQSYNLWVQPQTRDSILIFQHRMALPNRVDVVAWNMTKNKVEWKHEDLTKDGNSNHQQIFLHDDKAYFGGSLTYYCFDMFTGDILWEYDHPNQTTSFMILKSIYASSINAIVVKAGGGLFAFDPLTGQVKWHNLNAGASSIGMGSPIYYDGIIYYTADVRLFAARASNGKVLWSESSSRIPMGESNFRGELAIDPERRVLYATSRDKLFAIKLYED